MNSLNRCHSFHCLQQGAVSWLCRLCFMLLLCVAACSVQVAAVVDGNVMRVLCRQREIGGESSSQAVTRHLWCVTRTTHARTHAHTDTHTHTHTHIHTAPLCQCMWLFWHFQGVV